MGAMRRARTRRYETVERPAQRLRSAATEDRLNSTMVCVSSTLITASLTDCTMAANCASCNASACTRGTSSASGERVVMLIL
jgi:hypothetical protein